MIRKLRPRELAEVFVACWRVSAARSAFDGGIQARIRPDVIPAETQGVLHDAACAALDELPGRDRALVEPYVQFLRTPFGKTWLEIPGILATAQADGHVSMPNPSYVTARVSMTEGFARTILRDYPEVAPSFVKFVESLQGKLEKSLQMEDA